MEDMFKLMIADAVRTAVREEVTAALTEYKQQTEKLTERTYTRQQAAELLHVSEVTLWQWEKSGKLVPQRAGRRVLYGASQLAAVKK